MLRKLKHGTLSIRHNRSKSTSISAVFSSPDLSKDEHDASASAKPSCTFLSLPSELRNKIYSFAFSATPSVIDLDPSTFALLHHYKILALFGVSRQVHLEATYLFFSSHTFRLFPTYPGRYFKTKRPLLARLPQHYKASISTLELRLGPGWNNPPEGWMVNDALGLQDCISVRVLKVFVECDPSNIYLKEFQAGDGFYEKFAQVLLEGVLKGIPSIQMVEFDAWSSVKQNGAMITGLKDVVVRYDKIIGWGPERGWREEADDDQEAAQLDSDAKLGISLS